MADQTTGDVAATEASPAPLTPTVVSPPASPDSVSVSLAEYNRLQRGNERAVGMQKFHDAAAQHGFKSETDFDAYAKQQETISGLPVDFNELAKAFTSTPVEGDAAPAAGMTAEQVNELVESRFTEGRKQDAVRGFQSASENESKLMDAWVEKTAAEKSLSPVEKQMLAGWARGSLGELSSMYPDGHPLHGTDYYQPLSSVDPLAKAYADLLATGNAADAAAIGEAANASVPTSTPAAAPGGQGKPQTQETDPARMGMPSREDAIALLEKRGKQRGGGTVG